MKGLVKELAVKRTIGSFFTGGIVEWSANGKYLYSTCTNIVKVINLDDNLSTTIIGDAEESVSITSICLDNLRMRLVIAYNNQMVREYTLPTQSNSKSTVARTWKSSHTAPILVMKFNQDGSLLATGSADHCVKVWDMNQQHCTHTLKGDEVVSTICFIRDNRLLAGYIGGKVNLFDLNKGAPKKLAHTWENHTSNVTSIIITSKGRKAVFLSRDQTLSIVDIESREKLKTLPVFESIEGAVLVHNGNIVSVGEDGIIKEWLVETAHCTRSKQITKCRIDSISYNPILNQLLLVSAEENIFVVNFEDLSLSRQIVGFQDEIYSCCLLGKEESHLAIASNSHDVRLYDTKCWDCQLVQGHTENVLCVATAKWDKNLLASCSKDNNIILWKLGAHSEDETTSLFPLARATGHTSSVNAVRFSHNQRFLLSVSTDTMLKLWPLHNVDVKPKKMETDVENTPKVSCSSTIVAHAKDVNCLDVSLSDTICITGGMDKLAKLWTIDTRKMQLGIAGTLSGHRRGVADVKFAPHAQVVATCSGDMTIKIWDIQEKNCLQTLNEHSCAVFSILYVNGGTQLLSADSAGIVKIWTLSNGETEKTIEAHTDKVWSICTKMDESEYITAGSDGAIIIWKDITEEKREEEEKKRRQKLEEEQTLSNLLDQERYQEALEYGLSLVIDKLIDIDQLTPALAKLDNTKVQTLLDFATTWNTNSRTSQASQLVMHSILTLHHPSDLLKLPNITNIVQGMLPYSKRHFERLSKARQDVSLLKFSYSQMRLN